MRSEDDPGGDHVFDWFLQPDDLAEPEDGVQLIWRAGDIMERFAELEVEAILTPDGRWHATEAGQLWDDEGWIASARQILRQHKECLALRHVLHIWKADGFLEAVDPTSRRCRNPYSLERLADFVSKSRVWPTRTM